MSFTQPILRYLPSLFFIIHHLKTLPMTVVHYLSDFQEFCEDMSKQMASQIKEDESPAVYYRETFMDYTNFAVNEYSKILEHFSKFYDEDSMADLHRRLDDILDEELQNYRIYIKNAKDGNVPLP